jgi:hypothetical protein
MAAALAAAMDHKDKEFMGMEEQWLKGAWFPRTDVGRAAC